VTARIGAAAGRPAPASRPAPPDPDSLGDRQRARRERIVAAAVALMGERAYDDVQMKDLAPAAGVALGTMYRYFTSKEHVFAEALLTWSEGFRREVASDAQGRSVDRLKLAYRRAARAFERAPCVYDHLLALQTTSDPQAVAVFEQFAARQSEAFAAFLPRVPPWRRQAIVEVMSAVLDANLRDWHLGRRPIGAVYASLDRAADLLLG
jgi:TetR/AcrR family transcriptional regulator, cholesterol catabolism regulator